MLHFAVRVAVRAAVSVAARVSLCVSVRVAAAHRARQICRDAHSCRYLVGDLHRLVVMCCSICCSACCRACCSDAAAGRARCLQACRLLVGDLHSRVAPTWSRHQRPGRNISDLNFLFKSEFTA